MNSMTLSRRLMLWVISPLVLVFAALITTVAVQLNTSLPQMHEHAAMDNVAARSAEITRWLQGYEKWLLSLTRSPALASTTLTDSEKNQWLRRHMIADPAIDILFLADLNGRTISHLSTTPLDISARDYFHTLTGASAPDSILSQPVLSRASGEPAAVVAVPVRDEFGRIQGVLGLTLTMAELSVITDQLADKSDSREFGWVVNNKGLMVAHPQQELRMKLDITHGDEQGFIGMTALSRDILSGNGGIGHYQRPDGEQYTVIYEPVKNTPGWVIGVSIPTESFTAASRSLLSQIITMMVIAVAILVALLSWIARQIVTPIRSMVSMLSDIADGEGDLTQRLPVNGKDEVAQLANGFNRFTDRIHKLMQQVAGITLHLNRSATSLQSGSNDMRDNVHKQQSEVDQIAAAMNEMESTVREVAAHAQTASNAAQEGTGQVREGSMRVGRVREVIAEQAETLRSTADEVSALQESGNQIGHVMTVIRGIAEQTNLLALNAAIEAARAGEAGRGFAVVSDEVRQLASRTHESTRQIEETVDALQERITRAVSAMHISTERSQQSVSEAQAAHEALQAIRAVIDNIEGMNLQIAAATEEQSATAAELNRNLSCIVEVSNTTLKHTASASENIRELFAQAEALQASVGRFRL